MAQENLSLETGGTDNLLLEDNDDLLLESSTADESFAEFHQQSQPIFQKYLPVPY